MNSTVMNSAEQPEPLLRTTAFFSLSPIGGEGRGEGARRLNARRVRPDSAARPLTLTLSPDGGEGIRLRDVVRLQFDLRR